MFDWLWLLTLTLIVTPRLTQRWYQGWHQSSDCLWPPSTFSDTASIFGMIIQPAPWQPWHQSWCQGWCEGWQQVSSPQSIILLTYSIIICIKIRLCVLNTQVGANVLIGCGWRFIWSGAFERYSILYRWMIDSEVESCNVGYPWWMMTGDDSIATDMTP